MIEKGTGRGAKLFGRPAAARPARPTTTSTCSPATPRSSRRRVGRHADSQSCMRDIRGRRVLRGRVRRHHRCAHLEDAHGQHPDPQAARVRRPCDKILEGDFVSVPNVSGLSVDEARQVLKEAGFGADVAGRTYSNLSEGTVVYADPSGRALRGLRSVCTLADVPKPKETPKPKPKPTKTPDKPKTTAGTQPPKVTPSEAYPGPGRPSPTPGEGPCCRRRSSGAWPAGARGSARCSPWRASLGRQSPPRATHRRGNRLVTVRAAGHERLRPSRPGPSAACRWLRSR